MESPLQHSTAVEMARELVDIIATCLREEERRDAFEEFYRVCREGLHRFAETKSFLDLKIELEGDEA